MLRSLFITIALVLFSFATTTVTRTQGGQTSTLEHFAPSPTETVLHAFLLCCGDGIHPQGGLIEDQNGDLFGTTIDKGTCCGTVYELIPRVSGYKRQNVYAFTSSADGSAPHGTLVAANGALFGVTQIGGSKGFGTIYELVLTGAGVRHIILHDFQGPPDAQTPFSGLVYDGAGSFYGVGDGGKNFGAVYKLTLEASSPRESVVYRFQSQTDGENPIGRLVVDGAGRLYGVTIRGGKTGNGTVYRIGGPHEHRVLYDFEGGTDGSEPTAGLLVGNDGALYGTTYGGGVYSRGTVFKLASTAHGYAETKVYDFGPAPDGANPVAGLVVDASGDFFGTTSAGGAKNFGTVFELIPTPSGYVESILHSFDGVPDGRRPITELMLDAQGNIYGTTTFGGKGWGTVFKVTL